MAVWQWHPSGVFGVLNAETKIMPTAATFKCLLLPPLFYINPVNRYLTRASMTEVVGTGYTLGGVQVYPTTTYNTYLNTISVTFGNATWSGSFTARTAVIYKVSGNTYTDYPLCWLTMDKDETCTVSTFQVTGPVLTLGLNP